MKRSLEDSSLSESRRSKRFKASAYADNLSRLSDEILLRVFSNFDVNTLIICQGVSHRLQAIAVDQELWKRLYYNRFVRPRKHRFTRRRSQTSLLSRHTKLSRWLDEQELFVSGIKINWIYQYKLRLNWARGSCDSSEVTLINPSPAPPLLAKLHDGIVFTVDSAGGLRAWSYKGRQRLLSNMPRFVATSGTEPVRPSSFTIDPITQSHADTRLAVGYHDGSFRIYSFDIENHSFSQICEHPASSNGALSSIALTWPYLLTITAENLLSLYHLSHTVQCPEESFLRPKTTTYVLIASFKSHSVWAPLSLTLKMHGFDIMVSIAYSFPTFTSGWSAGIQEIRLNTKGEVVQSRLASAVDPGFVSLARADQRGPQVSSQRVGSTSRPTSLSYSHPYLLMSHSDNTLTVYVVTANNTTLSINAGKRLWGHTSSVFGAHIGKRGKAVSVSTRGSEIRIWELEGNLTRSEQGRSEFGVPLTPDKRPSTPATVIDEASSTGDAISEDREDIVREGVEEPTVTRAWVGFDEQSIVVLREHKRGNQALTVYDFT